MGRILSIDYGRKRTGIAVTDPLQIIATGLETVPTHQLFDFLDNYLVNETVELFVVGYPRQMNNTDSESFKEIKPLINKLKKKYPKIPVELFDERFTSKMAQQAILESGVNKKTRQNKGLVDKVSAVLILQSYMRSKEIKL